MAIVGTVRCSTIADLVMGLVPPGSGQISIEAERRLIAVTLMAGEDRLRRRGYVPVSRQHAAPKAGQIAYTSDQSQAAKIEWHPVVHCVNLNT